ncbi:DUF4262 domain-containing protein [Dactylosporangium sp. NPDC000244]|uniref:DUF4262 domain-containing protein n=1 Tax=Dactylosporangium sp. NPDC000244 TaxID=3154365 RepID=UPI003328973E
MPSLNELIQRQNEIIDRVGWAVMHILPTDADPDTAVPYAYTVGLTAKAAPELVITGLPPHTAHVLLNDMATRVADTGPIADGSRIHDLIDGLDAVIINGTSVGQISAGAAVARYGADRVQLQQIVWPDPHGNLPWDAGYRADLYIQPLLDRP